MGLQLIRVAVCDGDNQAEKGSGEHRQGQQQCISVGIALVTCALAHKLRWRGALFQPSDAGAGKLEQFF